MSLYRIRDGNGRWLTDQGEIANEAVLAFKISQLNGNTASSSNDSLMQIPEMISEEMNKEINAITSLEEVYEAILSLSDSSAAGPDGYNGHFYRIYWDIIKDDFYEAIKEFFAGFDLTMDWTSTLIIPIPKVDNPESFKDLHPINLCNFSSKGISKLLASRLAKVLPYIISSEQSGFTKGRLIFDNILSAQELVKSINNKVRGGNVILKVDVNKAYDTLSWMGLSRIMRKMGFDEVWIDRIY